MKMTDQGISRALPLLAAAAVPAALHAEAPADASRRAGDRPNIIYIMTDQQCATAMSCAGNMDVSTPNMDRLADVYRIHAERDRNHRE